MDLDNVVAKYRNLFLEHFTCNDSDFIGLYKDLGFEVDLGDGNVIVGKKHENGADVMVIVVVHHVYQTLARLHVFVDKDGVRRQSFSVNLASHLELTDSCDWRIGKIVDGARLETLLQDK